MTEQSEAEKAAEGYADRDWGEFWRPYENDPTKQSGYIDGDKIAKLSFLAGAAWAAPKWVHVNDKWPEPEKMVLVYIPDAAEWQRIRTTLRVKPEGKHNGLVAQWAGAAIGVTHWCELPAAPEVEK